MVESLSDREDQDAWKEEEEEGQAVNAEMQIMTKEESK